jgi:hypothetical protein
MDKVKAIVYLLFNKHLFWTLSIIVILMGFVGWWMSAGKLKQDFDANLSTVTTTKQNISTIASKQENQIFNVTSHTGMKEMNAQRRLEVYRAWRDKYDKQRAQVLVWPDGLSEKFRSEIARKLDGKPIEEADQTDLVFTLREEYRNEINSLLPTLAEMINAEWAPTAASVDNRGGRGGGRFGGGNFGGGNFGGGRRPVEGAPIGGAKNEKTKEYAVWWNPDDQGQLQAAHFGFADREELPTTPEILYSMEDYWVLKALMQIIARTNIDEDTGKPAELRHRAAIREIHSIKFGGEAQGNVGQIFIPVPAEGDVPLEGAPPTGTPPPAGTEVPMGEGGVTTPAAPDPANGRYVDKVYQPLPAEKLRSAATSGTPEEAYLAVAKRMPVRMLVKMDQRKLNRFLTECGNADLMLEVKQVRINPNEPDILSIATGQGGGGGFGAGPSRFGGGQGRFGGEQAGGAREGETSNPWDVEVEVYGIIYIFNPPSKKRLADKLDSEEVAKFEQAISAPAAGTTPPAGDEETAAAGEAATGEAAAEPVGEAPADAGDEPAAPADDAAPPATKPPEDVDAASADAAVAPAG